MNDAPLLDIVKQRIIADRPMPLADYMALALTDPKHGYYMTRQPFGRCDGGGGDFITAPEVSQMFGELIGIWCADLWTRSGEPEKLALVELGPGRGTLMADARRAATVHPRFLAAAQIHFVDVSPILKPIQAEAVPQAVHHTAIDTLPTDCPMLVIANEFFDALPIVQYRKTAQGWAEICVGLQNGELTMQDRSMTKNPFADTHISDTQGSLLPDALQVDDIIETCPAAQTMMADLGARLKAQGGVLLVIDYGYATPKAGDSFQALEAHKTVNPLARPGMADLTAHVNFASLAACGRAAGLTPSAIISQGAFLSALGIDLRAQNLCAAQPDCASAICAERTRLIAPNQMGDLFKVLTLSSGAFAP